MHNEDGHKNVPVFYRGTKIPRFVKKYIYAK